MFTEHTKKAKIVTIILTVLLLFVSTAYAENNGSWTPGNFEIHVFDVGQGDSQLIVSPSGKTMLIDVAEMNWNSGRVAGKVATKIREVMGPDIKHLDYIVATHLHLDHIGYVGYGGIWALLEKHGYSVGTLIDRNAGTWKDKNHDGACDRKKEIVWKIAGTTSGTGEKWICYVTDPKNSDKLHRETAKIGSSTQIDLGPDVTVTVIESDADGVKMEDGKTSLQGNYTKMKDHPSENDYSITLLITYGSLDYVTGGDTDGEYSTSSFGYAYNDVESIIAPRIGKVELLHVNHHGSGHSSNNKYLELLDPDVTLISCGENNKYGHPAQVTLDRLLATSTVYLTEKCAPDRNYGGAIFSMGDIVVKSANGSDYSVNNSAFVSQDLAKK